MIALEKAPAGVNFLVVRRIAGSAAGKKVQSAACNGGRRASSAKSDTGSDPTLWLYRDRTVALLRRYLRFSIEVGRLPSLLGKEFFRTRVTSYRTATFEDTVIFVHDVERSLEGLPEFDKNLIGTIVLQEYTHQEAAQVLGCGRRTVTRHYPEALDRVSEIFLRRQILTRLPGRDGSGTRCQERATGEIELSASLQAE
jgi:hypothetical protein